MDFKGFYTETNSQLKIVREKFKGLGVPVIEDDGLSALCFFTRLKDPESILEIGSAAGLSAIAMLKSCKANLIGLEKDAKLCIKATENINTFGLKDRAQILNISADSYLANCDKTFDFIFLDSAKSKYKDYLEKLIKLLNAGGILFCDNVLYKGLIEKEGLPIKKQRTIVNNLRKFLQMLKNESRLDTAVFQIGDGVSVSIKLAQETNNNDEEN